MTNSSSSWRFTGFSWPGKTGSLGAVELYLKPFHNIIYREQGHEIDLVLLDLNMPGIGGHKCMQELFQIDPWVRVVIASNHP